MKKVVLSLFILGFALSFANAKGVFIGIDAGWQKISGSHEKLNGDLRPIAEKADYKFKTSMPVFGLKGGYDFDEFRTYGKFSYGLSKDINFQFSPDEDLTLETAYKFKMMEFIVGTDWAPNVIGEWHNLKAVIGAFVGLSIQKASDLKNECCNTNTGECRNWNTSKNTQSEAEFLKKEITKTETSLLLGAKVGGIFAIDRHNEIELGLTYSKNFAKILKTDKFSAFIGYNYKF